MYIYIYICLILFSNNLCLWSIFAGKLIINIFLLYSTWSRIVVLWFGDTSTTTLSEMGIEGFTNAIAGINYL